VFVKYLISQVILFEFLIVTIKNVAGYSLMLTIVAGLSWIFYGYLFILTLFIIDKRYKGESFTLNEMIGFVKTNFLQGFLSYIIYRFAVSLGLIFLIIPGIFIAVRLLLFPFYVILNNYDIMSSIRISDDLAKGFGLRIGASLFIFIIPIIGLLFFITEFTTQLAQSIFSVLFQFFSIGFTTVGYVYFVKLLPDIPFEVMED
jgi:hypothetical protein